MAKRIWDEQELEQVLLGIYDGDEEIVTMELAKKRRIFTDCCTYNYISIGEPPPPWPPPPPPPDDDDDEEEDDDK